MMFSRKLLLVTVYVFTLLADIKVTTSSKATPHHGHVNGQQAGVCCPTCPIVQYQTGTALQCPQNWQTTCNPCATNKPVICNPAKDFRGVGSHTNFGNVGGYHPQSPANGFIADPRSSGYSYVSPPAIHGAFPNDPNSGSYYDPNRASYNDPNQGSYNDPHRVLHNGHAHNPYSSGTDPSSHHSIVGYPGYLVYQNVPHNSHNTAPGGPLDPAAGDDPQWETFGDSEWDAQEDPQWEMAEDPQWDTSGDPVWDPEDPEGDPNDPDDSGISVTDMISRMAQGVMSLGQNPAMGTLPNFLTNNNPVPNIANFAANQGGNAIPNPNIANFAANQGGNAIPNPNIADFVSTAGNILPQGTGGNLDPGITAFSASPDNTVPQLSTTGINTGTAGFPTNLADIPQTSQVLTGGDPAANIEEFAADQGNILPSANSNTNSESNLSTQQSGISPQSFANPSTTTDFVPDIEEFGANQGNTISQLSTTDSSNSIPAQQSGVTSQVPVSLNSLTNSNSEPTITSLAATQENTVGHIFEDETLDSSNSIPAQQDDTTIPELIFIPFVNDNDAQKISDFDATEDNILPPLLEINNQAQDLESDSSKLTNSGNNHEGDTTQLGDGLKVSNPVSDISEYRDNQSFNKLRFISPLITNLLSNNKNVGLSQKNQIRKLVNPSRDAYINSILNNSQKTNTRVPPQILFKSTVSRGGVQISDNFGKNANYIRSHIPQRRAGSICNAIRESAEIFNLTQKAQSFNFNPFLVLTPKNLTRSSLSEANMETYITAEEMETLYEEAVDTDKSAKVLLLPDFELSEEQIQNIVRRISFEISKEEGKDCQELVLIPLDLSNNTATLPSEISATAVENNDCVNTWSLPLYSDSGEIHYQQKSSETTLSSSSNDFETTTGSNNLPASTSQTCQTLTTENDHCNPILPIDIPPYPEMTTPCPPSLPDDLSLSNFSSSGAPTENELSIRDDQNQEPAKEEENCSAQSKNKTEHTTEIFIPCFISIGHDSNALDKKICEMQQNGYITKFLPQHCMFKIKDQEIQTDSGGTILSDSRSSQPCPPCPKEEIVHSNYSLGTQDLNSPSSLDKTCTSTTIKPINNVALSNPKGIWDSVNFGEKEGSVSDQKKSSYFEITTYPHQNNSASSSTQPDCAARKNPDDKHSSSFKVITYPITKDSEIKPILKPCTSEETSWNTDNIIEKCEVTNKQTFIDRSGTVNSIGDETNISNEYCHNQKPTAGETTINTNQIEYAGTSISGLDLIKENAKDNHHMIVGKDHILHPKTGITILDSIKKNANMNYFVDAAEDKSTVTEESQPICSEKIGSPLPETPEENEVNPTGGSENNDSIDDTHSAVYNTDTPTENIVNLTDNEDQAKYINDTKPDIPKCPSSKIFIVKIDNIKPKNGSCPCSSFNNFVDTICSNDSLKNSQSNNGNFKDHSCLCKLLSMHQQKINSSENTEPDRSLNITCSNSPSPSTHQEIPGYDLIPTNEYKKADDVIPPLEITKSSTDWDNMHNTDYSTIKKQPCDKNIDTTIEIDSSPKSPINTNCPCNLENVIEQQRSVSQNSEGHAQETCTNPVPLPPVCKRIEIPRVCPPSDKQTTEIPTLKPIIQTYPAAHKIPDKQTTEIPTLEPMIQTYPAAHKIPDKQTTEIPTLEPMIQTFQAAHKIPVPEICPPTKKPNYKPTAQNPPPSQPIPNTCPPCYEHAKTTGEQIFKTASKYLPMPQKIPSPDIYPRTIKYEKPSEVPLIKPAAQTVPMPPKIPGICPPTIKYDMTSEVPITKPTAQTVPIPPKIPEICPPTIKYEKPSEVPLIKPTAQTVPTPPKIPEICPPTVKYDKPTEVPIIKPTAQTVPTPPKMPDICCPSHEHSKTTFMPAIQTLPQHKQIPEPEICPSTDEDTKKTEIYKSTVQTNPTPKNICVPKECAPFYLHKKTIGIPFIKPTTQDLPIPQKIPVPNICHQINEQFNTDKIIPKPIIQTQDWEKNVVKSQASVDSPSCEKNLNNKIEIADELKASLNESCLCKLRAVLDKHRTSNGKTSQTVDEIIQKPYGTNTTFPTPQNDPVLTNCIPTDEQPRMNEVIPPSVSTTKDWNSANNYNLRVNNGSCRGDMKPTEEMDCKKCKEKRKELLAKILKEVFINNLDLLCEEKKP